MLPPIGGLTPDVQSTCFLNVQVMNIGSVSLSVQFIISHTAEKLQGGAWRSLKKGMGFGQTNNFGIDSGETKGDKYLANLNAELIDATEIIMLVCRV